MQKNDPFDDFIFDNIYSNKLFITATIIRHFNRIDADPQKSFKKAKVLSSNLQKSFKKGQSSVI